MSNEAKVLKGLLGGGILVLIVLVTVLMAEGEIRNREQIAKARADLVQIEAQMKENDRLADECLITLGKINENLENLIHEYEMVELADQATPDGNP